MVVRLLEGVEVGLGTGCAGVRHSHQQYNLLDDSLKNPTSKALQCFPFMLESGLSKLLPGAC